MQMIAMFTANDCRCLFNTIPYCKNLIPFSLNPQLLILFQECETIELFDTMYFSWKKYVKSSKHTAAFRTESLIYKF